MKKTFKVTGATAGTVLVALSQISPAFADEVAKSNSVVVKSEKLDAVVKEASNLGFNTTTTKEKRVAKTQEEFEKLQAEAKAELDELASKIQKNVDVDKQHTAKVKEAVEKVKDEEDEIKAKYPLLADKDGVRVYGKFNEDKKGSQAYYEDIHVFTDDESITPLKGVLATNDDTEFKNLEGTNRETSIGKEAYHPLGNVDSSPVGSKVKVTHIGDTLDGRRVDAIVTVKNFDFRSDNISLLKQALDSINKPYDNEGYITLTKWINDSTKNGELGVYSTMTKGLDLEFELVDENGNPINPVFALTHTDIDYGQGISVQSEGKILDLVPKNTLRKHAYEVNGRTYTDMYSDMGEGINIDDANDTIATLDAASIPEGSFVTVIKGSKFTWRHNTWRSTYDNGNPNLATGKAHDDFVLSETLKDKTVGYMYADIFGRGGKVNLHTLEIPTAPAIEKDFELKEIEVSLEQQPTTTYVDENGKQLLPPEKGEKDKKDIPGYKFVETKKKENGDIEHVYKKTSNITTYVEDKTGKELSPKDEGILEKKDIPEYEYVRTDKKENGDVEHVYRKSVTTTYVDENGNKLLPPEKGEKDKKDIPGYKFIETKKKENGDIEHVYKKVSKITTYVDESGKELLPKKEGIHEKEVINGYEFVKTNNKENGDVEHVYKQVSKITTYVDESGKELLPKKEGIHEKETINGYEFVKTVTKENGDVEHVYKKVAEKKLPATSLGIAGGIASVLGLTGVGAYFNTRKRKK
jgi:surface repeat SSSPR-51 protein